jgi:ATP-dependent Clp protease ATP-binding subunit ClpA
VKISVYLPDELASRVRDANLPVSAICQSALRDALEALAAADPFVDPESRLPPGIPLDVPVVRNLAAAIHLAYEAARKQRSATVETEDLLQGVLDEGENLMLRTLNAIGIDSTQMQESIDSGRTPRQSLDGGAEPVLSRRAERAVRHAGTEAARRGQPVNLAHLVLALLDDAGGGASRALHAAGLDEAAARRAIAAMESGLTFGRHAASGLSSMRVERLLGEVIARLEQIAGRLEVGDQRHNHD